jgi:uncharacterized protein (UPF0548 family)
VRQSLDLLAARGLTYAPVGATRDGLPPADALPPDAGRQQRTRVVGRGGATYERAADAVLSWQVQRRAGLRVEAAHDVATVRGDVLLRLGPAWTGRLALAIPCRVVWVERQPRRAGFAYGTLPGHPEHGEEAFVVEHGDDDLVRFTIRAYSWQAWRLARLAAPAARLAQRVATER